MKITEWTVDFEGIRGEVVFLNIHTLDDCVHICLR